MRALIRYAGFDPEEDVYLPEDNQYVPGRYLRRHRHGTEMDVNRMEELRSGGMCYRLIGITLALEAGRRMPYRESSVYAALLRSAAAVG